MRLTQQLSSQPAEQTSAERQLAAQAWQGIKAEPEEVTADRAELDKLERGIVTVRKQVFAARNQAAALQEELQQARSDKYSNPVVWSLGAIAVAAAGAWVLQRRRMQENELNPVPATPSAFPNAQEPSALPDSAISESPGSELNTTGFEESDLEVISDEADAWIKRARVAVSPG